ncbi:MAG: glycosyltransferase family 2 protein [Chlorobiaceae bacterium]|nr:glycosyltransferase family 2 protein [Chlorobiaceae bacterium]
MQETSTVYPAVTVIIPHLKNRGMLESCLDSLRQSLYKRLSVLVVDNGGRLSDLSGIETSYPEIDVIRLPVNAGYAGGCNEGLNRSSSKYVVFMNDDAVVDPGWLGPLVDEAERDPLIGALQPKILSLKGRREGRRTFDYAGAAGGLMDRLGFPYCLGRTFSGREEDRGQYDKAREIFWASGVAMFASRELLVGLGGFETGFFMHMEEIDLCWRLRMSGHSVRSVPDSVVWHEGGASLQEGSPMKVYYNHRNAITMLLRNRSLVPLLLVLPLRLLLEAAAALYYLSGGADGRAKAKQVLRAMRDNVAGFGATLQDRRQIQQARRVGDRALFREAPLSVFLLDASQRRASDSQ